MIDEGIRDRALGCLLGQFIGDALGSLVEFRDAADIAAEFPDGVRDLADGGTWDLIAGQPTDDSQMAMELALAVVDRGRYDPDAALAGYRRWAATGPVDIGITTRAALLDGVTGTGSEANGSLMRVSPLGVFGARPGADPARTLGAARADAALTHPAPVCRDAGAAFVAGLVAGIGGADAEAMVAAMRAAAATDRVAEAIEAGAAGDRGRYAEHSGWVLLALAGAVAALLGAEDPEEALVAVVGLGGDTDTNAAIAGAALGARFGAAAWPARWVDPVLGCEPAAGAPGVAHPLHRRYWPGAVPDLVDRLLALPGDAAG